MFKYTKLFPTLNNTNEKGDRVRTGRLKVLLNNILKFISYNWTVYKLVSKKLEIIIKMYDKNITQLTLDSKNYILHRFKKLKYLIIKIIEQYI